MGKRLEDLDLQPTDANVEPAEYALGDLPDDVDAEATVEADAQSGADGEDATQAPNKWKTLNLDDWNPQEPIPGEWWPDPPVDQRVQRKPSDAPGESGAEANPGTATAASPDAGPVSEVPSEQRSNPADARVRPEDDVSTSASSTAKDEVSPATETVGAKRPPVALDVPPAAPAAPQPATVAPRPATVTPAMPRPGVKPASAATRLQSDLRESVAPLSETLKTECLPRDPVIEGLIRRGQTVTLAALQGTGKSPFVAQLGLSVATGAPFLGLNTHQCRVALIDLESPPDELRMSLRQQVTALQLDWDRVGESFHVLMRANPADPNSRELERLLSIGPIHRSDWLQKLVDQGQYGLIIIDTALMFWPFKSTDEDKVRGIFSWLSAIKARPPYPSFVLTLHLRKPDRRAAPPRLVDDPYGWTDEIMGTRVWSTNADVRLGLEILDHQQHEGRSVFAGYGRGYGIVPPMILDQTVEDADGEPRVTRWQRCEAQEAAYTVLTSKQFAAFQKVPVGEWLTWDRLLALTAMPKVSLHRLLDRAERAGLLERDRQEKRYRVVADVRVRDRNGQVL